MKKLLPFILMLISVIGYAQIPTYYNDVNLNQSGQSLKSALTTKITNTHVSLISYTPGVWNALKEADLDPNDASKVILIYGYNDTDNITKNDRTRSVDANGGGSTDWNREHVYPKSLGNPNLGTTGPGADAHHIRAADTQWNSTRSSRKFADGSGDSKVTSQGHWYPGDEYKGDVARMMMYVYLRYGNRCLPTNVGVGTPVASDANMIQLFLEWNAEDPVSPFEDQRNNAIAQVQGNRNPFIDNPAFATTIWGGPQAEDRFGGTTIPTDTQSPSVPANLIASGATTSTAQLNWSASTDNVGVTGYEILRNGSLIHTTTATSYTVTGLTAGTTYIFAVKAKDAAGNTSAASQAATIATNDDDSDNGSVASLFFSEYVEGSSNNKVLEIANFTGSSVNLSAYSIKKQSNGSGSWNSTLTLSGTLANGDVYVIANSSASSTAKAEADLTTSTGALTFNGNDPVGLFKNNVLVDVIGTFNGGSSSFAQNTTLRRKSSVNGPNTTYTTSEWDSFASNTFNGLGSHTIDGGTTSPLPTNEDISFSITFDNYPEETSWEIKNANNQVVFSGGNYSSSQKGSTVTVSKTLAAGCYTFVIKDSYGDGICCTYGNGSYVLRNTTTGQTITSGSSFTSERTKNFCIATTNKNASESEIIDTSNNAVTFNAYPNPVEDNIIISLKAFDNTTYQVVNQLGQIVKKGIVKSKEINLSSLNTGMYMLVIQQENQIYTKRFVKK